MTLTVVATANHYVFDVIAGLAVTAAGFGVWHVRERRLKRPVRLDGAAEAPVGRPIRPVPSAGAVPR